MCPHSTNGARKLLSPIRSVRDKLGERRSNFPRRTATWTWVEFLAYDQDGPNSHTHHDRHVSYLSRCRKSVANEWLNGFCGVRVVQDGGLPRKIRSKNNLTNLGAETGHPEQDIPKGQTTRMGERETGCGKNGTEYSIPSRLSTCQCRNQTTQQGSGTSSVELAGYRDGQTARTIRVCMWQTIFRIHMHVHRFTQYTTTNDLPRDIVSLDHNSDVQGPNSNPTKI